MRRIVRFAPLAALALCAGTARAAAPAPYLSYSGYLLDGAGQPVTSLSTLQFNFYTTAGGTTPVYSDSLTVTPSSDGYFTAIIGVNTALDPATFKVALWMGIKVNSDPVEMSPRVQLTSEPYSLTADWQYLTNVPATFTPSSHTHPGSDITSAVANALAVPWTGITGTIFGGTGTASTAAHSDHNHDATYAQLAAFNAMATPGTINTAGNPVDWTKLKGVPAGFADGVDDTGLLSVTTDTSLTGAGTGGSPLAVNTTNIQSRVTGTCAGNSFVIGVNPSGTVNCGSGNGGTVTSVTATSPLTSTGGAAPVIALPQATTAGPGWLSAADWNTFNTKVTSVGGFGPITSSGGVNPVIGLGTVGIGNGGTGITAGPSAAGQYLRSTGAGAWAVGNIAASDLPAGNGSYVQNTSTYQTGAQFNVQGGTVLNGLAVGSLAVSGGSNLVGPVQAGSTLSVQGDSQDTDSRYFTGTMEKGWALTPVYSTGSLAYFAVADAPVGGVVAQVTNGVSGSSFAISPYLALDSTKNYIVEGYVRGVGGPANNVYLGINEYDYLSKSYGTGCGLTASNAPIPSNDGCSYYWNQSGITVASSWTFFSFTVGPQGQKVHASDGVTGQTAKFISLAAWVGSVSTKIQLAGWRIEPVHPRSLIARRAPAAMGYAMVTSTPTVGNTYNSAGGAINVSRPSVGTFIVTFVGLADAGDPGGVPMTSAFDAAGVLRVCNPYNWYATGNDLNIAVHCYNGSGVLTDSAFFVHYFR